MDVKIPTGAIDDEKAFAEVCSGLNALVVGGGYLPDDVTAVGLDIPGPVDDQVAWACSPTSGSTRTA